MNSNIVIVRQMKGVKDYTDTVKIELSIIEGLKQYFSRVYDDNSVGDIIKPGSKVVIKPNFVHEENFKSRFDGYVFENPNDCFITNWVFIKAIVSFLSATRGIYITILECPLQSCNISKIISEQQLAELRSINKENSICFVDGRRTKYVYGVKEPTILHDCRSEDQYIDFDLANESEHYSYEDKVDRFRVTDYPPSEMRKFHSKGKHVYRIAREIIDADYVFNVPKMKTHMKSGITIAMKNFVGVVGNKECLPHHIKGSKIFGGDCYGDFSILKAVSESLIDKANSYMLVDSKKYYSRRRFALSFLLLRWLLCFDKDITGSWYGNDTISRTIVDLNKIVYFGGKDGIMHDRPQRTVISVVDAIVSGQGEGPMRPDPLYSGFFCISGYTAAADSVCAKLIGIDPDKVGFLLHDRIERKRFSLLPEELNGFSIIYNDKLVPYSSVNSIVNAYVAPRWVGHIEIKPNKTFSYSRQFFYAFFHYFKHIKTIWRLTAKERGKR